MSKFNSTESSKKILKILGVHFPIIQAPMAGVDSIDLAVAVSEAGGLGSLACASLSFEQIEKSFLEIQKRTTKPVNFNFFCHKNPVFNSEQDNIWKQQLAPYYKELGIAEGSSGQARTPFSEEICVLLEKLRPKVVSFHFGLPEKKLIERLKSKGVVILCTATTTREARWLEDHGCDAIIAQGIEAGGHRGMFLEKDINTQVGTMALIPQVVDSVKIPVIATGGIGDARGIKASFALGAAAVQLGTAYMFCPEAKVSKLYLEALYKSKDSDTVITNVFSGRPARGILNKFICEVGPMSDIVPEFPLAAQAVGALRTSSEQNNSTDFMQMWSGQAASLGQEMSAYELTKKLAYEAFDIVDS